MANEFGPASEYVAIGKRNLDYNSEEFVTGRLTFAADVNPPGKLYAKTLGAAYAHAKIISINTSKAEALPGVKAVITYKDNALWSETVLTAGQQIAAVAAVDEATAERALDLIEVNYDVLIPVHDPAEAMKPGAPLVGTFPSGNVTPTKQEIVYGDVAKGFTEADVVLDVDVGWNSRHTHNELEPDTTVVWWEGDNLFCWITSQNPFAQRASIASALKKPLNQVHVYCHGTGAGFGGKGGTQQEVAAALLSRKAGKPVALQLSRRLYTVLRNHQYGGKMRMKLGAKNDGTLTAIECEYWNDGGLNATRGSFGDVPQSTWKCANWKSNHWGVATNKGPSGAWRCVAHNDGGMMSDIALEKMAERLKINPLEFRRKIFLTEPIFQQNNRPLFSFGVRECMEKVAEAIGYSAKYHAAGAKTLPDGRLHGIGIHAHCDGHGGMSGTRGGIINMCEDGTVLFNSGASRVQGGYTDKATIIAETIGVKYSDVHIGDWGNTDVAAEGGSQGGSTNAISLGAAFKAAADDVRTQLFVVAAGTATGMLKVKPEDLEAKDGKIFVKADPTKFVTHKQVMEAIAQPVIGRGVVWTPSLRKAVGSFAVGGPGVHRTGVAAAAEVAVDPDTGEVELLDWANAVDAGRVLDRHMAEGQVMAGQALILSQILYMDEITDGLTGYVLNYNHIHDKISTTMDVHEDKNQAFLVETIDANGPYGCHGIGEPSITSWAAISNAINNATGKWIIERPFTPQTILKALGKA